MNMKNFAKIIALCTLASVGAADIFMDFDTAGTTVPQPFELTEKKSYSPPRALLLKTDKKPFELTCSKFTPKKNLGVTFNYHHNSAFGSLRAEIQCLDAAGRVIRATSSAIGRWDNGWGRCEMFLPGTPAKTTSLRLRFIPLKNKKPGAELVIDNIRITTPESYEKFFPDRFTLPQFDRWSRRKAEDEKFLPGDNSELYLNWHRSKFGEASLKSVGTGEITTVPWRIFNVRIKPGEMYKASLYYVPEQKPVTRSVVLNVAFRNAQGKFFTKPVSHTLAHSKDWKELSTVFQAPAGAVFMDMRMVFVRAPKNQTVFFNRLTLEPQGPALTLNTTVDAAKRQLFGVLSVFGMGENVFFSAQATDSQNKKHLIILDKNKKFTLDLAKLPDGKFNIEINGRDSNGKTCRTAKTIHNYNNRPWENKGLGELPENAMPPSPWKQLSYPAERCIRTWNPEIELTPQLALGNIKIGQKQLLKAPIQLRLDGKDLFALPPAKITVKQTPNHAEYTTSLSDKNYHISVNAYVTFYGGIRYKIRLKALKKTVIKDLTLSYSPVCTDYLQLMLQAFSNKCTMSLRKEKVFRHNKLVPTIWCGNENLGVYSMFNKFYPAVEKHSKNCHEMTFDGEFKTVLVNQPLTLEPGKNYDVEFMLGSTPVRPASLTGGERIRFRAGKYSNMELMWSVPDYLPYCGFPIAPKKPAPLESFVQQSHAGKKLAFIYQIPFFVMADLPQFDYFFDTWRIRPERCYPPNTNFYPEAMYNVDVIHRSWQDLYLWHLNSFLRKYPFDGIYFDGVGTYAAIDRNGEFSYRTLAAEEFARRIYILQRKINSKALSFTHAGGSLLSVGTIFSDIVLTGEQFRYFLEKNRYYLKFMTLDEFRLQTGSNIGTVNMFLPQYRKPLSEEHDTACHTMGLVMLHNLGLYPSFIRQDVIDACRSRLYDFCDAARPTRFAGYWTADKISSGNPEVVISGYLNSTGKLLICLNQSGKKQNFPVPAGKSVEIYDPETNSTVKGVQGNSIELKPYLMKMVTVR